MNEPVYAMGIDLGGTNIKIAVIDETGNIEETIKLPTEDQEGHAPWKNAISTGVKQVQQKLGVTINKIGLAAPGVPDEANRYIESMPGRLEGLEQFIWSDFLEVTSLPVLNDAVAALIAEQAFGAGKGYRNLALLTLGTGVGGGVCIEGKLYQGFFQKAGHIGHMSINADTSWMDDTGMPGSLELAIGNATVPKRTFGKYANTRELVAGYRNNEPIAVYAWMKSVQQLAVGVASVGNLLSPDCILLGGGICQAGKDLFEPLQAFVDIYEWRPTGQQVVIKQAYFTDFAGAVGAAAYALQNLD